MPKLDRVDKSIITLLRENCLTPFVEIARKVGVAEGTVRYRVKRLLGEGVIRGFTAKLDLGKIGLKIVAFALISVLPGQIQSVAAALGRLENVIEIHEIHTYGDLLIKIRAESLDHLGRIMANQIKIVKGVVGSQVISVLNVWKEE